MKIYERFVKRLLDFILSLLALIILSPLLLVTAILVRVRLGSPVLFRQDRPGRIDKRTGKERIFKLYKFRTMTDERDPATGEPRPDEVRLTSFGKKLRSTSIDELPELINILKGDMAIVGPRPLLVRYLPRYSKEQRRRHEVRPGLTGLAQVNGRNAITWEEKFKYDVAYVDNISFVGDVSIIIKTVKSVIKHEGISSATSATMEEFKGNSR
ncbi:MAG: sugar transferase [Catonella sp.]|nr:sugar transferase [Catonella sp.]MDY6356622.1 sugar transferase [Catonella sp.]